MYVYVLFAVCIKQQQTSWSQFMFFILYVVNFGQHMVKCVVCQLYKNKQICHVYTPPEIHL